MAKKNLRKYKKNICNDSVKCDNNNKNKNENNLKFTPLSKDCGPLEEFINSELNEIDKRNSTTTSMSSTSSSSLVKESRSKHDEPEGVCNFYLGSKAILKQSKNKFKKSHHKKKVKFYLDNESMLSKDFEIKIKNENDNNSDQTEPIIEQDEIEVTSTSSSETNQDDDSIYEDISFGAFSTIGTDEYSFSCPKSFDISSLPSYLKAQRRIRKKVAMSSVTAGGGDCVAAEHEFDTPSSTSFLARDAKLNDPNVAIVDSGANKHLLRELKKLRKIREANIMMQSSNGGNTRIDRVGDLHLRTQDENGNEMEPLVLSDASILKGSPLNLVSVGMLCEKGSTFHFEKGNSYFVYNGKRFKMEEHEGLFLIRLDNMLKAEDLESMKSQQPQTDPEDLISSEGKTYGCAATYDLWHQRFGHASKKRIKFLYKTGAVEGLEINKNEFNHDNKCRCPTCVQVNKEKIHVGDVRKYVDDITQVGQKVVCDLCGPFPPSIEGYRYVISFTDSYSRFSACYCLSKKSDSEQALESFIRFYRKEGFLIKCLRSDQGGEFGGHNERQSDEGGTVTRSKIPVFDRLCQLNDIKHELTPANRPELHGLAERWNKTVITMANAMLFSARLSHVLWSSAVAHANMLRNRLPLRGLGDYTPYTIFYHKRPRVDQLKVFGCDCYKLLPTYPKIPGQMSRKRLIFVGFTPDRLGFRCFDPIDFKFTTEWELEFDEASTQKRVNALREYDERRKLNEKGQLDELPLIQDADVQLLNEAYDNERRLFASPPSTQNVNNSSQGGRDNGEDNVVMKTDTVAAKEKSKNTQSDNRNKNTENHNNDNNKKKRYRSTSKDTNNDVDSRSNHSARNPLKDSHQSESQIEKLEQHEPEAASCMGSEPVNLKNENDVQHSISTLPTHPSELGDKYTYDGKRIEGPWERPARSTVPVEVGTGADENEINNNNNNNGSRTTLRNKINELKNVEDLLLDKEAEKYGPLSQSQLEHERSSVNIDNRFPTRPLRIEPIGVVVHDTENSKLFRKAALENDYLIKLVDNPKRKRTESWKRYKRYQPATCLREIIELSATSKSPDIRKKQIVKARADIVNDYLRGYILFPEHEHRSSSHFINASTLAMENDTVNVYNLYSEFELKQSRDNYNNDIINDIDNRLKNNKLKSKDSTSFLTFQDQLRELWEYDEVLDRVESRLQWELRFGASSISELLCGDIPEPKNYKHAVSKNHPERDKWKESMKRERTTLADRNTWIMVKRKNIGDHKPVKCKYVYKKKRNKDNTLQFKSRLVGCGYSMIEGVDYHIDELYAGVCSYSSMRFLMSYAVGKGYILSQSDITGAYLEADVTETIYMEPPPDMFDEDGNPPVDEDGDEVVCLLKRSLYGLKSSGYAWSECFKEFMLEDKEFNMGFEQFTGEPNMYRKVFKLNGKKEEIIVGIYVDDCLIAASSEAARKWYMERLSKRFPVNEKSSGLITVKDPGLVLSMNVRYDIAKGILQIDQRQSIELLAKKFNIIESSKIRSLPLPSNYVLPKLSSPEVNQTEYLSIIGSCLHISQVTRPDIAFAVGVLSRHSATPGKVHMQAALDLVSYLYHTRTLCIQYDKNISNNEVIAYENVSKRKKTIEERLKASIPEPTLNETDMYTDADYAGDKNTRRSTSGMIIMMNGGPISWSSRLQKLCALSTPEAEIYAVTESVKEAIHIKLLCEECDIRDPDQPMTIYEDNNACIQMGHGLRGSKAAKHYEVRLRFLNEHIRNKTVEFARIDTKNQLADMFTKALPGPAFNNFRDQILVDEILK